MELDLSGWNTAKVVDSESMFEQCEKLKTIYVGDNWKMNQVKEETVNKDYRSPYNMFKNCYDLKGGNGMVYDANKTSNEYAIVDGGKLFDENDNLINESAPGYLTKK